MLDHKRKYVIVIFVGVSFYIGTYMVCRWIGILSPVPAKYSQEIYLRNPRIFCLDNFVNAVFFPLVRIECLLNDNHLFNIRYLREYYSIHFIPGMV
jgi:hypothetical protein